MQINFQKIKKLLLDINIKFETNLNDLDILDSISSVTNAQKNSLIFVFDEKYLQLLKKTKAKCCVIKKEYLDYLPKDIKYIAVDDPYMVFAYLSNIFYQKNDSNGIIADNVNLNDDAQIKACTNKFRNCKCFRFACWFE